MVILMSKLAGEAWITSREKRLTDLSLATGLLPIGVPLCIGAAVAIRAVDGVDPIFMQDRPGLNEEPYTIYKLRTMPDEGRETISTGYKDPRASKIGKVLRKIRLDEVPQLYNIYRGEMSVVGPRPIIKSEYEEIMDGLSPSEQKEWTWARSVAKPGMIDAFGLQAYSEGYTTNTNERVELDIAYATSATFRGDAKLIASCLNLFTSMFDREQPHEYKRGGQLLELAANAFGVELTEEEKHYWDTTFRLVKVLDNLVDEDKKDNLSPTLTSIFNTGQAELVDDELASAYHASIRHFSASKQNEIYYALCSIPIFAEKKFQSSTATHLLVVSLEEARLFASILTLDENTAHPERAKFNQWLVNTAQAGISFDAALDLRADASQENVSIKPTIKNSLTIAKGGLIYARRTLASVDGKTAFGLAKAAGACIVDR